MYGELDIQLKSKRMVRRTKKTDDFKQFKTKIFTRMVLLLLLAVICIWWLYTSYLYGNFAEWMVTLYQKLFRLDYVAALNLYQWTFRNYMEFFFLIAIVLVFFIIFRIYLGWFTKYFEQINQGIDCMIQVNDREITLPSELFALERKMNTIKHTIEKQKSDILTTEQRKNDLIMYLAHDLKTPLASVIGYLNLLYDEQQISEELRKKYLGVALGKAEHLEDLINEFFEIAKFNLSTITLQYSWINLTRLLEMLLYEFQPMLQKKNLHCNLQGEQDVMLRCDANKMQRVLDNLLRNAVLYSFEETQIDIAVTKEDNQIAITFINHGEVVPEDKIEQIFEQFYRLDSARSTTSGGAGLGLAIAKQIVELHHGTITAKSDKEQTKFVVVLPSS